MTAWGRLPHPARRRLGELRAVVARAALDLDHFGNDLAALGKAAGSVPGAEPGVRAVNAPRARPQGGQSAPGPLRRGALGVPRAWPVRLLPPQ